MYWYPPLRIDRASRLRSFSDSRAMLIGIIVGVVVVIVTWICIAIRQQERKALESQQREIKKIRERNEQERKKLESRQREIEKKLESRQREIEKKLESRQREIEKTMKILKGCEQVYCLFRHR